MAEHSAMCGGVEISPASSQPRAAVGHRRALEIHLRVLLSARAPCRACGQEHLSVGVWYLAQDTHGNVIPAPLPTRAAAAQPVATSRGTNHIEIAGSGKCSLFF
jgi:hypothetical protein